MEYQDFLEFVRRSADENGVGGGLVRIPELRRRLSPALPRHVFDAWLTRCRDEGNVHLLTHVDPTAVPPVEQVDCLTQPDGPLIYWVRWLSRSTES